jgi:hypothetical protein
LGLVTGDVELVLDEQDELVDSDEIPRRRLDAGRAVDLAAVDILDDARGGPVNVDVLQPAVVTPRRTRMRREISRCPRAVALGLRAVHPNVAGPSIGIVARMDVLDRRIRLLPLRLELGRLRRA